jgi:signal transduction histidine kinase
MTRRLLLSYVSITLAVLAVLVLPLGAGYADRAGAALLAGVERDAHAVADAVSDDLRAGRTPLLDAVLTEYQAGGGRIVVVDRDGRSVGDSDLVGEPSRDFSTRPEVAAALAGRRDSGFRYSETLGQKLLYVAIPVTSGGVVHGAVRVSYPTAELDGRVHRYWLRLGGLAAVVLAGVVAAGFVLARGVTRPVRELERAARELSSGRLEARAEPDAGAPELRALAATFNTMADRIARLVGSQRLFVADAAHQLRTPLTALRLRLENLDPHLPDAQRPKLDAALAETERLGRLVDSLLALAGADAGAVPPAPADAVAVASGRVEAWAGAAAERGVRLTLEAAPCPPVLAVPGALEQILDNLVANAVDAAAVGSGSARSARSGAGAGVVTVRVGVPEPCVVAVEVLDDGPGVGGLDLDRVFEPFWRGREARPGSGFGLGLAIARRLAGAGGGSVDLGPRADGSGAVATVRLVVAGGGGVARCTRSHE